ncbi:MAG TPA: hypothetical protein VMG81_07800 [Thermoplasmata archaeon]|nr:hypothetical protein [Thermoplasmata archaeon]
MAAQSMSPYRRKPPLYRLARALRWAGTLVFVLVLLFVATALYSAYETATSSPSAGSFSTNFATNDTLAVTGQLTFSNGGFYPIDGFTLHLNVRNASGIFIGQSTAGPVSFGPGASQVFPVTFFLPISSTGPATSLLTEDQNLEVGVWANATYAYLFPISVALNESKAWGAPFADFTASVGTPTTMGGSIVVPVTVQFQNHATFADQGTILFTVLSSEGATCGSGNLAIDVPPGSPFSQTTDVTLASGCSPAGGSLETTYVTSEGVAISLPTEAIP